MPIVGWILFFIVSIMIWMMWYFNNTALGRRVFKSNGIERIVKVYDVNGQLIAQYDGKLDITCDGDRISELSRTSVARDIFDNSADPNKGI